MLVLICICIHFNFQPVYTSHLCIYTPRTCYINIILISILYYNVILIVIMIDGSLDWKLKMKFHFIS